MFLREWMWRSALALSILVALVIPWPGVHAAYGYWFRWTCGFALYMLGFDDLRLASAQDAVFDVEIRFAEVEHHETWSCSIDSFSLGFLPTAIFLALFFATRIAPAARWRTLAWGLLAIQAYILVEIVIVLLWRFTMHASEAAHAHAALLTRPSWQKFAGTLYELVPGISGRTSLPILIWAATCFRGAYWRPAADPGGSTSAKPA